MEIQKEFLEMVGNDIGRIDKEGESGTDVSRWKLFREMCGKYQVCIADFYEGMWWSVPGQNKINMGTLQRHPEEIAENLELIKAKLQTFRYGANGCQNTQMPSTQVTVNNNISVEITFEEVRSWIEDMTSLTDEQTKEALEKVSEIEAVVNGTGTKKSKWEKIKPILIWLADKSFDVAMTMLPLLLKLQ